MGAAYGLNDLNYSATKKSNFYWMPGSRDAIGPIYDSLGEVYIHVMPISHVDFDVMDIFASTLRRHKAIERNKSCT